MDFERSARSAALADQLGEFIAEEVAPAEAEAAAEREAEPEKQPPTVERLKAEAKRAGLWNLCVRHPDYGPGLSLTPML